LLIVVALGCAIMSYSNTSKTTVEEYNDRAIESGLKVKETTKALRAIVESAYEKRGEAAPDFEYGREQESLASLAESQRKGDEYKSERNQKILLWAGAAGVCFLSGIVCVAVSTKKQASV
ncbi:MAG: hypothetical protein JWM68_4526, partial [Verrucomicrobiales bacterium]|nr:hypothetical protein [Verrucomicrobiales bacterium]